MTDHRHTKASDRAADTLMWIGVVCISASTVLLVFAAIINFIIL
jgi:hypothetical protein